MNEVFRPAEFGACMKNVLMLTYMYYPANHIASHRPGKMVKYLGRYRWNPVVVCPDWTRGNSPYFDPDLLTDRRNNAAVHAIPYEPLWGGNLFVKAVRCMSDPRVFAVRALRRFHRALQKNPPEFYYGAVRFLREYLRCHRFDCIWATEAVCHAIAARLHAEFRIPWVADFRDVFDQKGLAENARGKAYLKRIEPKLLATCSLITTVSEPLREILQSRHSQPVHVVENGFDHEDYAGDDEVCDKRHSMFHIVYTGKIIYPHQDPSPLFEGLKRLLDAGTIEPTEVKVSLFGTEAEGILRELTARYDGLDRVVDVRPRITFQEALRAQKQATVLLLLAIGSERGILTGKVFEYLGARRPILCVPGDHDCVDALLARTHAGVVCRDAEDTAQTLAGWYARWQRTGTVAYEGIEAEIKRHSRRERARVLAGLLDRCAGTPTRGRAPVAGGVG